IYSSHGKVVGFRQINPGDMFGEFAAIDGRERSATVEAMKVSSALVMSASLFKELMENDSAFLNTVLLHLVKILRCMTARVVEFSTLAVKNRIHNELLRLAKEAADGSGLYLINPAPTHSEIAAQISTHREAVSREISRLKRLGLLERRGKSLIVKDRDRLEKMVHEASGECLIPENEIMCRCE
ncbi:MAG: Crp/Fnr family transcriptional regulator, partial [Alphaproteobacteria bacterium]